MLSPFCILNAPFWAVRFISRLFFPGKHNEDVEGCEDRNCCNCAQQSNAVARRTSDTEDQVYLFELRGTSWKPHCNGCNKPIEDRISAEMLCSEFSFHGKTFHLECCRGHVEINNLMEFNGAVQR